MGHPSYATANAGIVGLTRAVARGLFKYGITCNAYAPIAMTRLILVGQCLILLAMANIVFTQSRNRRRL